MKRNYLIKSFCVINIFILAITLPGLAQLKSHEIGRLWDTQFPTGSLPSYSPLQDQMTFPGGDFFYQKNRNLERQGLWIGVKDWTEKWIAEDDTLSKFHAYYVAECGPMNFEATEYTTPVKNKKYVRNRLPIVEVNNIREERLLDSRRGASRIKTLEADEKITTVWKTKAGITVSRNSYAFAQRQHDCYHIAEYVLENSGDAGDVKLQDQNLTGVYFGFFFAFIPSGDWGHDKMGGEKDDWVHYYGNEPGDSLRGLWYCYDGDSQKKTFDDIGDPSETTGEFLSPQYIGAGVLHADQAYDNENDASDQPVTVNWWPDASWYSHNRGDDELQLYSELNSGVKNYGTDITSAQNAWEPTVQHPMVYVVFGPYDIPFGEDIRIVLYKAGGMISRKLAIEYGRQWKLGELEYDELTGDEAKNVILATGKDSLFLSASRAEATWHNGLASVPDGPPAPGLKIWAGPGKVTLTWDSIEDEPDPDTGELDFMGYRIFRAESHYTNEYQQIWECCQDSIIPVPTTYVDMEVQRGTDYYYYVVGFDYDGHESSHFYNRNYAKGASPFLDAYNRLDSVFVVPNPFHAQGLAYGGTLEEDFILIPSIQSRPEDKMLFVGLPYRATIRIFTVHGDLVRTVEHPDPAGKFSIDNSADYEWYQISVSWQTIKSGVYFFHVEGWNREGIYLGTTTGKFVVIR